VSGGRDRFVSKAATLALVAAALIACNIALFAEHYAGAQTFPWDFSLTYLAVPHYWISHVAAGFWPSWVAHQGFGYPLSTNMQSGLFYPPHWVFALSRAPFSCEAATSLACLHVLLGGIAMAWLVHRKTQSWALATIGGVAFQLLGPAFGNAQHPDIVRGYALCPWMWIALDDIDPRGFPGRLAVVLVPLVVFLFVTGAYPGQWIAAIFLAGLAIVVRAAARARREAGRAWRAELPGAAAFLGLVGLGVLASSALLLPGALMRSQIDRGHDLEAMARTTLSLPHLATLVFPYDMGGLSGDVSMRTLFVPLPVLLGLFGLVWSDVRRVSFELFFGAAATLLAFDNVIARSIVKFVPPLGLSRFPSADYRGWITAALTLAGVLGLARCLAPRGRRTGTFALRYAAMVGLLGWLAAQAHWQTLSSDRLGWIGWSVALTFAVFAAAAARIPRWVGVLAVLAVVYVDGNRAAHAVSAPWHAARFARDARDDGRTLRDNLRTSHEARPARTGERASLEGYFRGTFVNGDYSAGDQLGVTRTIRADKNLTDFFSQPGQGFLLTDPPTTPLSPPLQSAKAAPQILFSATRIRYKIESESPAILVENEPSYPGWTASQLGGSKATILDPMANAWPARAWRVPAGSYEVELTYHTPGARLGAGLSLAAVLGWLALAVLLGRGGIRRRGDPVATAGA
jgi:hypothetical protein